MAESNRKAMLPENAAKMSMSRWKRSHQKGAESSRDGQEVVAMTMARRLWFLPGLAAKARTMVSVDTVAAFHPYLPCPPREETMADGLDWLLYAQRRRPFDEGGHHG